MTPRFGLFLKRHSEHEEDAVVSARTKRPKKPRIRCPKCRWRPLKSSRWYCSQPSCGCTWNTFDTHGKCPKCSFQWRDTACPACSQWSKHEAWYER